MSATASGIQELLSHIPAVMPVAFLQLQLRPEDAVAFLNKHQLSQLNPTLSTRQTNSTTQSALGDMKAACNLTTTSETMRGMF
jgi:hypothetical protein